MQQSKTAKLCTIALLIALEIILTRFCSINTTLLRIGFGFLPVSIVGIMYGPLWAASAYAVGDIVGGMLFPTGPFFPGFTVSAFLSGLVFGLVLHNHTVNFKRALIASAIVVIFIDLCMNTYWLSILYDDAYIALLPTRIFKCVVTIPIETLLIPITWQRLFKRLPYIN